MTSRHRAISCWAALLVLAWLLASHSSFAQQPIKFRRIFVPQEHLEREIGGLLPLKREEFERRVSAAATVTQSDQTPPAARIERATYTAQLTDNRLLQGTAELKIVGESPSPLRLPLGKCNLALTSVQWQGASKVPAVVGQDSARQLTCLVEGTGTLQWNWSLQGISESGGSTSFALQLPPAAVSSLQLELPQDLVPMAQGRIVSLVADTSAAPASNDAKKPATRKWLIEIGGSHDLRLKIGSRRDSTDASPLLAVREQSVYALQQSSLDLETTLEVEALRGAESGLQLHVDRPLQILSIRTGDLALEWSLATVDDKAAVIRVKSSAVPPGEQLKLQVQATGAWTTDTPLTLPRIVLDGALYQEGRVSVAADPDLGLQARPLSGCWQSGVIPLAAGRTKEEMQFRLHEARAAIEVAANPPPPQVREALGTQLVIDATKVSAVAIAELTSLSGESFNLEAPISRRWIIDAVEVQPADALSDRTLTADAPNRQMLRLQLQHALSKLKPLRVLIRAHRRLPTANEPLERDFFRIASFADGSLSRRIVGIRTLEPGAQLQLSGDQRLTRLDPLRLPEHEMRLFETVPSPLLFVDDEGTAGLAAEIATAAPSYRVDSVLESLISEGQAQQKLTLRCLPNSSTVGQIVVRLSPRPGSNVTWTIAGDEKRELHVEGLTEPDGAASESGMDASYRLTLLRPRSEPFEVRAEWLAPSSSNTPLSLATVPDAAAQSGIVLVRSPKGNPLIIESTEVDSLPILEGDADNFSTLRGHFSYRPGRRAALRVSLAEPQAGPAAACIELLELESRFANDGDSEHTATLHVLNQGATRFSLRLPPGAMDLRQIDEAAGTSVAVLRTSSGLAVILLPSQQRRVSVHLRYTGRSAPLNWLPVGRLEAPVPEPDIPVLARQWRVAVCPGLQIGGHPDEGLSARGILAERWTASPINRNRLTWAASLAGGSEKRLPPRSDAEALVLADSGLTGWTTYRLELPVGPVASIRVYRTPVMSGLSIAAFLLAALGMLRFGSRMRGWVFPLAALLLGLALVALPEWLSVAAGLALGLTVGAIACAIRRRVPVPGQSSPSHTGRPRFASSIAAVCVVAGAWLTSTFAADPPPAADVPPAARAANLRVVIAVDDLQQPVGEYVYLSPGLYDQLLRQTETDRSQLPDWLLMSARYHFPVPPRLTGTAPSIDQIAVTIDLATFRPDTIVSLPLQREQVSLLEAQTRLDGGPVKVTWRDDGRALLIPVEVAGTHQLQLALGANLAKSNDNAVLDLAIPEVSQALVTSPLGLAIQPTIRSALGGPCPAADPRLRQVALGPTARLVAHWPLVDQPKEEVQVEVEQLTWWKFRSGSVVLNGKFRLRPVGGAMDRFQIEVDPRLRIVKDSVSPAAARWEVTQGARSTLQVLLAEKTESEITFSASWLYLGSSGIGNLSLPHVVAQGDRVIRSWTATSVEPPLTIAHPEEIPHAKVSRDDFLVAWNEPESPPDFVTDDQPGPALRSLTVLPAQAAPQVATNADWSLDGQQAGLTFSAQLSGVPAMRFRHVLDLPPTLKVNRVELTAGGATVPHRWRQGPDGSLVVTLLANPPPVQSLVVTAVMMGVPGRPRLPLPIVRVLDTRSVDAVVSIRRQPAVAVRLQGAPGWEISTPTGSGQDVPGLGRQVAVLHRGSDERASQPMIAVSPNRPQVGHRFALRVAEDQGVWTAEAHLDFEIADGVLDLIRLEVPAVWTGPYSITPAAEYQLIPLAGGLTSQLVITPQQAQTGKFSLSIRGPLLTQTTEPVRAPAITVLDSRTEERIVVLATRAGKQATAWETRGLEVADPSTLRLPDGWLAQDAECYRAVSETYEAAASFPALSSPRPGVTLAEISVSSRAGRRFVGRARFNIEPPASGELVVELPPNSRPVQLALDGAACQWQTAGLRAWRVATNSQRVPTCLEVLFEGALPEAESSEDNFVLSAPRVRGLTVARTLWLLTDFRSDKERLGAPRSQVADELEMRRVRMETYAQNLARIAALPPGDVPVAMYGESYRYWRSQYQRAQAGVAELHHRSGRPSGSQDDRYRAAERMAQSADRKMASAVVHTGDSNPAAIDEVQLGNSRRGTAPLTVLSADAWLGAIALREVESRSPPDNRWFWATMLVATVGTAFALLRLPAIRDRLAVEAPACLAVSGLLWWLFAPWPWLGWIAFGMAVWLALRWPWSRFGGLVRVGTVR